MNTLIHTPCSRRHKIMDGTVTALGWTGFAWLFIPDSVVQASAQAIQLDQNAITLFSVALIGCNACLMSWSAYNRWLHRHDLLPDLPSTSGPLDEATLAAHFCVPSEKLDNVHESRRTIIYHTDEGDIVELETETPKRSNLRLIA